MKKKALSLVVAAALAAPTVALAEATFYGQAHVTMDWFDITGNVDTKYKGWTLNRGEIGKGNSRDNRLGVKGSEDLGRGLKAIYQIEFNIPLANNNLHLSDGLNISDSERLTSNRRSPKMRNSYAGLKGAFGTVLMGRHDTPFKLSTSKLEFFDNTMADYQGTLGFDDHRVDGAIAYVTPSIQNFQFAAALIPGAGKMLDGDANIDNDGLAEGYSLAATYANGPLYFGVAHEVLGKGFDLEPTNNSGDFEKWRVGFGLRDWAGFSVSALYENQTSIDQVMKIGDKDNDATLWQGQIGYAFGNNMVKAMYGEKDHEVDADGHTDAKSWAIGFDHKLSPRTKAYALYTNIDDKTDEEDWKGASLGMIHSF